MKKSAKKSAKRDFGPLYYVVLASMVVLSLVILSKGQHLVDATQSRMDTLEDRIREREQANRRLAEEISDLQDPQRSRTVIERIARDELNMAAPEETVYEFRGSPEGSE